MCDQPNKVGILLPSMQVGGAERLVLEELSALKADTRFYFELHLVFDKGPLFQAVKNIGIPVKAWNAKHDPVSMLWTYFQIANHLRRNRFNVLHCHLIYHLGPWVGITAGIPKIITTVHTKAPLSRWEKMGLNRSHVVFACGKEVAEHLKNIVPQSRVKLLTNAIGKPKRNTDLRRMAEDKYGLGDGDRVVLSVGRLIYDKGYDVLIEAFRRVSTIFPKVSLLIAGDGPGRGLLAKQIVDSSLQGKVLLLGTVLDLTPLYERADIYVNCSRREGLPLTLLEACAYGKPIVATDTGGNKDIVVDGVTGVLVKPSNSCALSNALLSLLGDKNKRAYYSLEANKLFNKQYSIYQHAGLLGKEYLS